MADSGDAVDYATTQIWDADKNTPQPAPVNGENYVAKEASFVVTSSTAKELLETVYGAKGVGAHISAPHSDILSVSLQCLNEGRLKARVGVRVWYLPSEGIDYGAGTPHSEFQALTCSVAATTTTTQPTTTTTTTTGAPSPSTTTTTTAPAPPPPSTTTTTVARTTATTAVSTTTTVPGSWATTTTVARPVTTTTTVPPVATTTTVAIPPPSQFPAGVREMVEGLPGWREVVFRSGTCTAGAHGNVTATYQRGNPPVICFSSGLLDDSWNRRRFIAAHELAHHFLWDLGGYDLAKNESLADCVAAHWTGHKYRNRCSDANRKKAHELLGQSSSPSTGQSGSPTPAEPGLAKSSSGAAAATTTTIPAPPATISPVVLDLIAAGEPEARTVVEDDSRIIIVSDDQGPNDQADHPPSTDVAPDLQPTVPGVTGESAGPTGAPAGPEGGGEPGGSEADSGPEPLSGVYQALLFGITLGMFRGYGPLQRLFAPEG